MDLGMEPKTFALLAAVLLFLTSFLVNLLQRRSSKARFERMLKKEESIVTFLEGMANYLNELQRSSSTEMDRESSLKKMVKAINTARDTIEWTLDDMKTHLSSFRQYRRKEKAQEKDGEPQKLREPTL
jgi:septal ring factor EnvC (AmiA/AmiB activator)